MSPWDPNISVLFVLCVFLFPTVSVPCFLNFLFICSVSVVFFGEFVENGRAFAQEEEPQKCIKLIDPTTVSELQELRVCLKKLARERKDGNENKTNYEIGRASCRERV